MGIPSVGDVLLINFPYADMKTYKKRPAIVVARGSLNTVILCQITSKELPDVPTIRLSTDQFIDGQLSVTSYIRPDKLFTVDGLGHHACLGKVKPSVSQRVRSQLVLLFS